MGRAGGGAAARGEAGDGALLGGVGAARSLDGSYQKFAWGSDELLPVSNAGLDNNGHVGVTLVEALDTLWLMGLRKEFDAGVQWIRENLSLDVNMEVSAFEYNTRLLGGLLSAYELCRRGILLEKAVEVGNLLLRTFKEPGFPAVGERGRSDAQPLINPRTGALEQSSSKVFLAEVGALTLEMKWGSGGAASVAICPASRRTCGTSWRCARCTRSCSRCPPLTGSSPIAYPEEKKREREWLRLAGRGKAKGEETG